MSGASLETWAIGDNLALGRPGPWGQRCRSGTGIVKEPGFVETCLGRRSKPGTGVGGAKVHGQVRCSFHSPSHTGRVSLFVLDGLVLGEGDRGNAKLCFLLSSIHLVPLLHPGAVIPHLES